MYQFQGQVLRLPEVTARVTHAQGWEKTPGSIAIAVPPVILNEAQKSEESLHFLLLLAS
jgi:hypothetical protein